MATSVIDIYNSALRKLGQPAILSVDDESPAAAACKAAYEACRDDVLRIYPWPCALKRTTLARLADAPAWGYSYAYALPGDCLRVFQVNGDASTDYQVESGQLLTDEETVDIRYVRRITAPVDMDASLAEVVAFRLAWEIAYLITASATQQELVYKLYSAALAQAILAAGHEQGRAQPVTQFWTDAR